MVNLWATASAAERSAPLNRKKNAFCTVDSHICRTRKVRSSECQLDWAVFLVGPGKADVLTCSGSQKQQLLVRVALPAPSVHGTAFLCSLRLGLQDGIYIHGRNTSIYIYRSWFCFYSSQDLFILFGKFSFILTVFYLFFLKNFVLSSFFSLLQLLAITQCFPDVM
jgi:hypothetical protein